MWGCTAKSRLASLPASRTMYRSASTDSGPPHLDLVRCADRLGFDGIVKGSHFSAHPFESVQQIPFLSYCAAIAPRLRIICGLVLAPLHKPLDLAEQLATLDLMSGGRLVFGAGI